MSFETFSIFSQKCMEFLKLFFIVSEASGSISTLHFLNKPACCKPNEIPPAPENKSTKFMFNLLQSTFLVSTISQFELKRSESKSDFKALYLLIFLSCALLSKFTLYGSDLQKIFNLKQQNTLK